MKNTTEIPEVKFSDRMTDLVDENLTETVTAVDSDTLITPNGVKYISLNSARKMFRCSKSHFYGNVLSGRGIGRRHLNRHVYYKEIDLINVANEFKKTEIPLFSKIPKDGRIPENNNKGLAIVDLVIKEKEHLEKEVKLLYNLKAWLFGAVGVLTATSFLVCIENFNEKTSFSTILGVHESKEKILGEQIGQLRQDNDGKWAEIKFLQDKLAAIQAKGDQK
jgi:hypothetical protein